MLFPPFSFHVQPAPSSILAACSASSFRTHFSLTHKLLFEFALLTIFSITPPPSHSLHSRSYCARPPSFQLVPRSNRVPGRQFYQPLSHSPFPYLWPLNGTAEVRFTASICLAGLFIYSRVSPASKPSSRRGGQLTVPALTPEDWEGDGWRGGFVGANAI